MFDDHVCLNRQSCGYRMHDCLGDYIGPSRIGMKGSSGSWFSAIDPGIRRADIMADTGLRHIEELSAAFLGGLPRHHH